ncbi:hypothetical protein [Arsukibacterium sp.]|uniref:hypothetical protein n=1 Tax=Arsukibacterium sp. TaxID=1977258 RepID=UPI00299E8F78|nr:hypothetical protein [Arsukibacterium sp.]MDX1678415.1 hypothetical protein [Arsukibacterium sp.]
MQPKKANRLSDICTYSNTLAVSAASSVAGYACYGKAPQLALFMQGKHKKVPGAARVVMPGSAISTDN